jgi:glycosyltransferase involved in cell wall biosynthesis
MIAPRLLVDGIFFQLNNTGIARVWSSILRLLVATRRCELFFLDRGMAPQIDGVQYIPYPRTRDTHSPADSSLIQKVCDHFQIDAFTSTYYSSPLNTPMVLIVYDMIPELFGFDLSQRWWLEKEMSMSYAQRFICISQNTRNDFRTFYPEVPSDHVAVAYCGVDPEVFYPRTDKQIAHLKTRYRLNDCYFIFVGSRVQHGGYKNSRLFFEAVTQMKDAVFDVFCVGGEPSLDVELKNQLPAGVRCIHAKLSDEELAVAYSGSRALVYPSLYEGFGMPVIEAMASACPVITTSHGALSESAGSAAYLISGESADEMRRAIDVMLGNENREAFVKRGIEHASSFRWQSMAKTFAEQIDKVILETKRGDYDLFFGEWRRLREIQASVDHVT